MNYKFFKVVKNSKGKFQIVASVNNRNFCGFGTVMYDTAEAATANIPK